MYILCVNKLNESRVINQRYMYIYTGSYYLADIIDIIGGLSNLVWCSWVWQTIFYNFLQHINTMSYVAKNLSSGFPTGSNTKFYNHRRRWLQAWNDISVGVSHYTARWLNIGGYKVRVWSYIPLATCQTSKQCLVSGRVSRIHFWICTCLSVTIRSIVQPSLFRLSTARCSPSFSIWTLLFTSLLWKKLTWCMSYMHV